MRPCAPQMYIRPFQILIERKWSRDSKASKITLEAPPGSRQSVCRKIWFTSYHISRGIHCQWLLSHVIFFGQHHANCVWWMSMVGQGCVRIMNLLTHEQVDWYCTKKHGWLMNGGGPYSKSFLLSAVVQTHEVGVVWECGFLHGNWLPLQHVVGGQ